MKRLFLLLFALLFLSCTTAQNGTRPETLTASRTFVCYAPDAAQVCLTGDMNRWDTNGYRMNRDEGGYWRLTLVLPEGRYGYRFDVDGRGTVDPSNPWMASDGEGGLVSVAVFGPEPDYRQCVSGRPHGEIRTIVIQSRELDARQTFRIYLPPDYDTTNRAYPVLFLLHGIWANQNFWSWSGGGKVQNFMDNMLFEGEIEPFVIVMPFGANSFYTNQYERLIVNELYTYMTDNYRILPGRTNTGIGGYSMGGFGAFYLAQRNPERYGISIPMSGYFNYLRYLKTYDDAKLTFGSELDLFCGTTDPLCYPTVQNLVRYLDRDGIRYRLYVSPGIHQWMYWKTIEPYVLRFASAYFYGWRTNR